MVESDLGSVDLDLVEPVRTIRLSSISDVAPEERWLVHGVWPVEGVGVVAATPKIGKTWIAADLGLSVASATPFAGRFAVHHPGRVIMFACEDRHHEMKDRMRGLASARGLSFDDLAIELVDEPMLSLNLAKDLARLERRIRDDKPVLVVLDPLRRVYSGHESSSDAVATLLTQLRRIQRQYHVAILLTHHVTKQSEFDPVSGHSMRGSGDIHAWGDVNLYAWRSKQEASVIVVKLEHRNSAPQPPFLLRRVMNVGSSGGSTAYLEHIEGEALPAASAVDSVGEIRQRVLVMFGGEAAGIGFSKLRGKLGVGAEKVSEVLRQLESEGLIFKVGRAWCLRSVPRPSPGKAQSGTEPDPDLARFDRTI